MNHTRTAGPGPGSNMFFQQWEEGRQKKVWWVNYLLLGWKYHIIWNVNCQSRLVEFCCCKYIDTAVKSFAMKECGRFYENIFLHSVWKRGDPVIRTIQWALTIKAMAGLKNGEWFQSAPRVVWGDHVKILAQAFVWGCEDERDDNDDEYADGEEIKRRQSNHNCRLLLTRF